MEGKAISAERIQELKGKYPKIFEDNVNPIVTEDLVAEALDEMEKAPREELYAAIIKTITAAAIIKAISEAVKESAPNPRGKPSNLA